MDKVLSVSIAAYNVSEYIRETLDCFVGVRGADRLDVMIVDDGSKDSTAEIAQTYVDQYPDVFRLIRKQNGGWGSTVNTGIANARGKYFKLLDGDDYYIRDHIAYFLDGLEQVEADLVLTPSNAFASDTKERMYDIVDYWFPISYRAYTYEQMKLKEFNPSVYGVCFKTNVLREAGISITEKCFYTDVEYVLKGCNACKTVASMPMEIYCYRKARAGQSMSLSGIRKHYKEHLKMLMTMLEYDKKIVTRESVHEFFNIRLAYAVANMYKWFLFQEVTPEHKRELVEFDYLIKNEYPQMYAANLSIMVGLLRRSSFRLYPLLAKRQLVQDQKKKIDVFAE